MNVFYLRIYSTLSLNSLGTTFSSFFSTSTRFLPIANLSRFESASQNIMNVERKYLLFQDCFERKPVIDIG